MNRHLKANTDHNSVRKFESLPEFLYVKFLELSKLAYEGFEREDVIFYGDIGEHFGFLDAVPNLYGGCEISFNFLHLTLQEFFAAYYISQMFDSGMVDLFGKRGEDERWNVVWRFVAGLTEFKVLNSCSDAASLVRRGRSLSHLFIQCLFETQDLELDFRDTFGNNVMACCEDPFYNFDFHALGYCIANCTTKESFWAVGLTLSQSALCAFPHGLMTIDEAFSTGVIVVLDIEWPFVSSSSPSDFLQSLAECVKVSPLRLVGNLTLKGVKLRSVEDMTNLYEIISQMRLLMKLELSLCDFRPPPCYSACGDSNGFFSTSQRAR